MKKTTKVKFIGSSSGKGYLLDMTKKEERLRKLKVALLMKDDFWRAVPQPLSVDKVIDHYMAVHHLAWKILELQREIEEEHKLRAIDGIRPAIIEKITPVTHLL